MKICKIKDCGKRHQAQGYCQKHYNRLLRHGDVNYVKRIVHKNMTPYERLMKKVVVNPKTNCWELNKRGIQARLEVNGKSIIAYRFAYEQSKGNIPKGMLVCHSCDNPACCNPEHLWLGTAKQNSEDMVKKGRQAIMRGEEHSHNKLTNEDIVLIRKLKDKYGWSQRKIADEFGGISQTYVGRILNRTAWSHIK